MDQDELKRIQAALKEASLEGWLLADFHGRNDVALQVLRVRGHISRRSFFFIPAEGEPIGLVSPVEATKYQHIAARVETFRGYQELETRLAEILSGRKRVAMEYSPLGRLPYIGLVDAGTIEFIRGLGIEIFSSADLVAGLEARLTPEQVSLHRQAAGNVIKIMGAAHHFIAGSLGAGKTITECDVTEFILTEFQNHDMITQYPPNCSVDANAGDPHYDPKPGQAAEIKPGQLVLIDLWAKLNREEGIYADITWMAYAGTEQDIPNRYREMFDVLVRARDAAVKYLVDNFGKRDLYGAGVDDCCRAVIEEAGFGIYFTHRTGHSITTTEHGRGPNIDNLETEDRRILQPGHLFSIEPGIYMEDCGFRTEINVLITESGPEVTTVPLQESIRPLL